MHEQEEAVQRHDAKAQKDHERRRCCCHLMDEGSKNEDEENSEEGRDVEEDEVDDEEEECTQVGRLNFFGCHTDRTSHSVL